MRRRFIFTIAEIIFCSTGISNQAMAHFSEEDIARVKAHLGDNLGFTDIGYLKELL